MKDGQLVQQEQMQGRLTDGDGDDAGVQTAIPADLILRQPELLIGHGDPAVEPFALRRQRDAPVGAGEQLAA